MTMLHVLQRSDNGLLHIGVSDDPFAYADALSKDQVFEVLPVAVFPGSDKLEAVRRCLGPALKGSWYQTSVAEAIAAVARALMEDELSEPSPEPEQLEPAPRAEQPGAPRLEDL